MDRVSCVLMKRGDMKKAIFLTSFLFISMDTMGNSISIENSGFSVSYKARVTLFPVTKNKPTEFSNEVVEWSNSDNVVESSEFFSLYDDYSCDSQLYGSRGGIPLPRMLW